MSRPVYYYKVTRLVKADMEKERWDAQCDETFGVESLSRQEDSHMSEYVEITKEEFEKDKHKIFTEEGGI